MSKRLVLRKKIENKNGVVRLVFSVLAFLAQTAWVLLLVLRLNAYYYGISVGMLVLAFFLVLYIYNRDYSTDIKVSWIILILAFPIMGSSIYIMYGRTGAMGYFRKKGERIKRELSQKFLNKNDNVLEEISEKDLGIANQFKYLSRCEGYPVYESNGVEFYSEAYAGFKAQMEAIKSAEKFVFLEYFTIEDTEPFTEMKELLAKKVKEGVEVRIIYDDVGSMGHIYSPKFIKQMRKSGIQCKIFNYIIPVMHIFMNNRDHRKMMIIDGKIGFTGGYNLAKMYFNISEPYPYGYWKDTGIRITGRAVRSMTCMFLEMWNFIKKEDTDYDMYMPEITYKNVGKGYIQPYADTPLDHEPTGENVYLNIIKNAKNYVFFVTPYLILSDAMKAELCMASKRGIDVRIITPGVPDKKLVYQVTRSNYESLLKNGVRIFEYTQGFCHAKQCVADDEIAAIGTINLDFRSLHHHFENGVLMYRTEAVDAMKDDFIKMFELSKEIPENYGDSVSKLWKFSCYFLRMFSVLL